MPIAYDPSNDALLRPELRPTLFTPGCNPDDLQLAVEASRLAYFRVEETPGERLRLEAALSAAGFGDVRSFRGEGTIGSEGFGALRASDGAAILAFRGTQPDKLADLGTDADFRPVAWGLGAGDVHAGFRRAYLAVHTAVDQWLRMEAAGRSRLIVCGHSLGGALASLCASIYRPSLLATLGCPLVGDKDFVAGLNGIAMRRLVDCCDVVTSLPPTILGYAHPQPLTYISYQGKIHDNPAPDMISADRNEARLRYLQEHAWRKGTVTLRDFADHAPINYARAFFP
jgi:hypothetical protein